MRWGANLQEDGRASFRVWAPKVDVLLLALAHRAPIPMQREADGDFFIQVDGVKAGDLYKYQFEDGRQCADPVSRSLPQGPSGPSEIVDPKAFVWSDASYAPTQRAQLILYECHIGTFTREGTFVAAISRLPHLKDLGINCLQIMPVATFSGRWNWGYDGVSPFAPHALYGGPLGLKALVDACHACGIAVCLDVVYNHFGPEGCVLCEFGYYLTNRYTTPWGDAVNYDGWGSAKVREYIVQNALYWLREYHIDALRLDAVQSMHDQSDLHILAQLSQAVHGEGKLLLAETEPCEIHLIRSNAEGGYELDAIYNEDFHHAAHVLLTQEAWGYYEAYCGMQDLATTLQKGTIREQGIQTRETAQLIAFLQNHDQVGNRPHSNRLSTQLSFAQQKTAAALLLCAPFLPLLFMGQEYGEMAPFAFFIDPQDPALVQAAHHMRNQQFGDTLYPDKRAFAQSHLTWHTASAEAQALLRLHKDLIAYRKAAPPQPGGEQPAYDLQRRWLSWEVAPSRHIVCYFGTEPMRMALPFATHALALAWHTQRPDYLGAQEVLFDAASNQLTLPCACALLLTSQGSAY